ncbi:MAG: hypothetical protein LBC19_02545, partial [Tannerella sp.]|nr:hypothetical protein [Tannerella sp.]
MNNTTNSKKMKRHCTCFGTPMQWRVFILLPALFALYCRPLAAQVFSGYVKEMPGAYVFQQPMMLPDGEEMRFSW